jgi:uncharacterized protein (DUF488 family)
LPIERFVALLATYGIECLADIRTVPRSRHNPQFNSDTLGDVLRAENVEYVSLSVLGGLRHARKDSPNTGWRNKSFRGYGDPRSKVHSSKVVKEINLKVAVLAAML